MKKKYIICIASVLFALIVCIWISYRHSKQYVFTYVQNHTDELTEYAEEIIENFLSEESIVINYSLDPGREFDRNVCEESYLVKDAMQQLGLFDLTIEYNEDNTINLNLELSGKKLMNIEEAIEKSRKELKNKCMNKLSTLVKSII